MTGINQLPRLFHLLLECDNGRLVFLTEPQSRLHLGSIAHYFTIQLFHLFGQALLIVCTVNLSSCRAFDTAWCLLALFAPELCHGAA